ncbi:MAG: preprotein translocase subunit SecE [Silvibacterium sp.]|nr:preprotein translocase subunit SecE [Silvibacterium sp.]
MPVAEKKSIAKAGPPPSDNSALTRVTGLFVRTRDFLKDVRSEMRKVVTPTRAEARATTTVVIVTVFAFAAFFYVVDSGLDWVLRSLLHALSSAQ